LLPDRYDAPNARRAFDEQGKIDSWAAITRLYAEVSLKQDSSLDDEGRNRLIAKLYEVPAPTPEAVRTREASTGHDVVAFLALFTAQMDSGLKRHIHHGLTSSDLVENAHFRTLRLHAGDMSLLCEDLTKSLSRWELQQTIRAGRTHGQIASLTSLNHQMRVVIDVLRRIRGDLDKYRNNTIIKSAGPTGLTPLHRDRDWAVANNMGGRVVPSTQVVPRDYQIEWAALYLRLGGVVENLALQVRLGARSEVGEFREGAGRTRVGSSSMPHKQNPIDSEKICGLGRVARGYFSSIAENITLWEDRDLSNSSLERIVVPGLAATVEHMLITMIRVMSALQVDFARMRENAEDDRTLDHILQGKAQEIFGLGPIEAGELVRNYIRSTNGTKYDGEGIVRDYGFSMKQVDKWYDESVSLWEQHFV
jgi:adenylosuccinate lyase